MQQAPGSMAGGITPQGADARAARRERDALRLVATMEVIKGIVVFGAGFGLLSLLHRDVRQVAVSLVTRLHLDPEQHFAGVFITAASRLTDARLWGFAALAAAYSVLRWVEAYGLWFARRWAAWLGAASGAIYLPVEVRELWMRPNAIKVATLIFNVALVAYLLQTLQRRHTPADPAR
jgi:uncharacterized membrane protein (DUF2068 family)